MEFEAFKQIMKKARKDQHIRYHLGNLGEDRVTNGQVDLIARWCSALYELDTARLYQKSVCDQTAYYVVLTKRLRTRKDEQSNYQEAERIMELM